MDKMSKKMYKILARDMRCDQIKQDRKSEMQGEYKLALKGVLSTALLVFAAVFGGLISALPTGAAFVIVFAYICVQLLIWLC